MWAGAPTMHLSCPGIAPRLLGRAASGVHDPLDDLGVGELDDHAVGHAARDGQRLRPVARDPHGDARQLGPHPLELERLVVPLDLGAVHELAHHRAGALELRDPHRLAADVADGRVAAPDAHRHPPVGQVLERRVRAREHGRVARRRVRDEVAEPDRGGLARRHREHRHRLLPEDVRVVRPRVPEAVALGELDQLEPARERRIRKDGDAEVHCAEPTTARVRRPGRSCRRRARARARPARRRHRSP